MVRIFVAIIAFIGFVLALRPRRRRPRGPVSATLTTTTRIEGGGGLEGSGERAPLNPRNPELSGGAAKRLGEEEPC
jgi:hypothetical protein